MLAGPAVGLLGRGRIGQAVARRQHGFAVDLVYCDPVPAPAALEAELGLRRLALDALLGAADSVSLHMPLTAAARGLIGRRALGPMKRDAVPIDTSRGAVVDQPARPEALRARRRRGAELDVCTLEPLPAQSPHLALPRVIPTLHLAAGTRQAMAIMAQAQLADAMGAAALDRGA